MRWRNVTPAAMDTDRIQFSWRSWAALIGVPALVVLLILYLRGLDNDRRHAQFNIVHDYLAQPVHAERLLPLIAAFDPADTNNLARIEEVLHVLTSTEGHLDYAGLVIRRNGLYYDVSTYSTYNQCFALEGRKYLTDDLEEALDSLPPGEQLSAERIYALASTHNGRVRSGVRVGDAILTGYASRDGGEWE